jgi:hypothetical protein
MQIEVRKSEEKVERVYPYIGESRDGVRILFTSKQQGMVIAPVAGECWHEWSEDKYTPIAKVKKLIIETE